MLSCFLQRGTPPDEAVDHSNHQPHIVVFIDEPDEFHQYFVALEGQLLLESANISTALYLCLGAHYIFNLKYHKKAIDVWQFIQEKIAGIPSKKGSNKKNPSYVNHCTGICRIHSAAEN